MTTDTEPLTFGPTTADEEFWNMVRIEEEANCDISAGIDHGPNLGNYLASALFYIDNAKLMALLQEALSELLPETEIETLAERFQNQVREQIQAKSA